MTTEPQSPISPDERTQFAVLLFTDICDSTALKAHHGAMAYKRAAELHNALFEKLAAEESLTLIKNTGDGYFARTTSVAAAVRFALRFQHGMRGMAWPGAPLVTRVGIHAGEVADITTLGMADVLAPAADLVARVMGLAVGGQILLTRSPFDEARHFVRAHPDVVAGLSLTWLAHGPYLFKGCAEPVEVFEVGATACAPLTAPPDGEKAKRALRPGDEETLGWRPACGLEVPGRTGWLLARKIGEGGFGEVWLAEQAAMKQRRVFKFCFDEERLRSFKRELTFFRLIRDALGERPDIARLYDVKLDEPPFFLESEFAEHGNLVEWCEKQDGIGAVPLPRRLELVAQIAEAVAAAHSVGILHKDLKPQNVLMQTRPGGEPAPQITDFGIGALADKAALSAHAITAAGFTVNTLVSSGSGSSMTRLYAPPEQLTGKVFTMQGDVYSLGVMLYQIIIGDFTRALAPGWEREVKDDILREDLAECLDGEPARRLASAAELAERLRSLEKRRAEREHEHQRAANNARRKRNARLALGTGAVAAVIAVALGVGLFRERELRKRADEAERLAKSRLNHAQEARDAAEKLVAEAIFGLREKLVPLGKIDILDGMATAAEEYYAKLPVDLVSDVTRRHEVMLALNRGMVATVSSDDETTEASYTKALALARGLAAKTPGDEVLYETQYFALLGLANLRFGQSRAEELEGFSQQFAALAEEWLRTKPKAPGAFRAKLAGQCVKLISIADATKNPAAVLPLFLEVQAVANDLKQAGGETMETRVVAAVTLLGKAFMTTKLGRSEASVKLYAESDAAFRAALTEDGHPLVREMMLHARKYSIEHLGTIARERGDTALEREAYRQTKEVIAEQTALAEFEPARLERWKQLGWLYDSGHGLVRKFDGNDAWVAWLEKGIAAADRAASPKFDRPTVRSVRTTLRRALCAALKIAQPAGWEARAFKLLAETSEINLAPASAKIFGSGWQNYEATLEIWRETLESLKNEPEQRATLVAQARAMATFSERIIELTPDSPKPRRSAHFQVNKVAILLRERGCPEAAELTKLCERWRMELDEKFADDPEEILSKCSRAQDRCWVLLAAMRAAPADQKDARFAELQAFVKETITFLEKHQSRIPEYYSASLRGGSLAASGSALLERNQLPEAETALREVMTLRSTAAKLAQNPNDTQMRRWDAADSQGKLGQAIFKQSREDEGRKLRREAAETMAAIAKEGKDAFRLRMAGNAWRDYTTMLPAAEKLSATQQAVELFRESIRVARLDDGGAKKELPWCLEDSAWGILQLGELQSQTGQLKEAESNFREALSLSIERATLVGPEKLSDLTYQRRGIRNAFVGFLLRQTRPDEAREQVEQLAKELQQLEATPGAKAGVIEEVRKTLTHLRSRLPAQ